MADDSRRNERVGLCGGASARTRTIPAGGAGANVKWMVGGLAADLGGVLSTPFGGPEGLRQSLWHRREQSVMVRRKFRLSARAAVFGETIFTHANFRHP